MDMERLYEIEFKQMEYKFCTYHFLGYPYYYFLLFVPSYFLIFDHQFLVSARFINMKKNSEKLLDESAPPSFVVKRRGSSKCRYLSIFKNDLKVTLTRFR